MSIFDNEIKIKKELPATIAQRTYLFDLCQKLGNSTEGIRNLNMSEAAQRIREYKEELNKFKPSNDDSDW